MGMCHVKILDRNLQVLPPEAADRDIFCSNRSFQAMVQNCSCREKLIKHNAERNVCCIAANYTNHSLSAYGGTTIFQAVVSEKSD